MTTNLPRAIQIAEYIDEKSAFFEKKADRAKKHEIYLMHNAKFKLYRKFSWRAFHLIMNLRNPKKFGENKFQFLLNTPEKFKQQEQERITKGKEKFLKLHRYSVWFMSSSLGADYGTYQCDKCGRTFYHSPSTITRALETIYKCACGYCTNQIIQADWGSKPFE